MQPRARDAAALAGLVLIVGLTGCAPQALQVEGAKAALPADDGSPGFLDRMASQQNVCENDAFRGMLMLLDGQDKAETFQQRAEKLAEKGVIARGWRHDAARALTKGKLAYMVCQACKVRGGVTMTLTGPSQRYCLRELQYQEMMSSGSVFTKVTGMEFVAVLTRADTYMRTGELPGIMKTASGGQ
jgi:hypothetical protein